MGLGVAVVTAGCSVSTHQGTSDSSTAPTPRGGSTGGSPAGSAPDTTAPAAAPDADSALVAAVLDEVSAAHALVKADRRAHPSLARRLRGLERLHASHAAELGGLVAVSGAAAEKRRARVLGRLADAEADLQRRLVDHSVAAESGALALLLAAMAAGVAQERDRL